jgi:hypothetical protein
MIDDDKILEFTIRQLQILRDKYILQHRTETNIDVKRGIRKRIREVSETIEVLEEGV